MDKHPIPPASRSAEEAQKKERSEFLVAMRNGVVLGALVLLVAIPVMRKEQAPQPQQPPAVARTVPQAPPVVTGRLPDFGRAEPSADAVHVANWAYFTGDYEGRAVVIVDKKQAVVHVLGPDGRHIESAPALLGSAIGDDTVPGIGDKPLDQILPHEKTTPAGRFIAQPGRNTLGEDIIWVDYDAAVSMHRVRPLVKAERRLERLASPTADDNRISFGCINLPVAFYEQVLSPTVKSKGAVVYVLPEQRSLQEVFASYDVTDARAIPVAAKLPPRAAPAQPVQPVQVTAAKREREVQ